jgi:hypothetical protein
MIKVLLENCISRHALRAELNLNSVFSQLAGAVNYTATEKSVPLEIVNFLLEQYIQQPEIQQEVRLGAAFKQAINKENYDIVQLFLEKCGKQIAEFPDAVGDISLVIQQLIRRPDLKDAIKNIIKAVGNSGNYQFIQNVFDAIGQPDLLPSEVLKDLQQELKQALVKLDLSINSPLMETVSRINVVTRGAQKTNSFTNFLKNSLDFRPKDEPGKDGDVYKKNSGIQ